MQVTMRGVLEFSSLSHPEASVSIMIEGFGGGAHGALESALSEGGAMISWNERIGKVIDQALKDWIREHDNV